MDVRVEVEEDACEPVSPTGQYFNSSVLSISVLCVLESEIPIDDSMTFALLNNVFLPINPRFSSIMVTDKDGLKRWKRVEVKLKEHVIVPKFPQGLSPYSYDGYLSDYLSKITAQQLPQSRPLWEVHIIKYPTSNAAGNLIFKLHHALGDGYSLMGALLSCLQRRDDPSLPLTLPSLQFPKTLSDGHQSIFSKIPKIVTSALNTASDFGFSLLKSSCIQDDITLVRSGSDEIEFNPTTISTLTFSLDQIKKIKTKLGVTINDVIAGMIFLGTRLYMQTGSSSELKSSRTTALVLLNTRDVQGYKSVEEMVKPHTESSWGNQFGFLHVSVPDLTDCVSTDPLEFILNAHKLIKRKRNSLAVGLTGQLLEAVRKFGGPETTARYIHTTLKNSSMTISNMVGPIEPMALANHPVKGLYFMVNNVPQSLTITVMSYMNNIRIAFATEKGFIDPETFKSSIEKAFDLIFSAACQTPSTS